MEFPDPGVLICGFVISTIGLGLFIHGKNMQRPRNLGIGLVMMIFPIFVPSILWMCIAAAACIAGVYLIPDG